MRSLICQISTACAPEASLESLHHEPGAILLRSALRDSPQARYTFLAARPFLTFRSFGSLCELVYAGRKHAQFGNPWCVLENLLSRYELPDEVDLPFPLGGCFGYWGYELKNFIEPKLPRHAAIDLDLPDCYVGFYDSLVVFDHWLNKTWIVSTGLRLDGSTDRARALQQQEFWQDHLTASAPENLSLVPSGPPLELHLSISNSPATSSPSSWIASNLSRADFVARIEQAKRYIRAGDIYQVNLTHRLAAPVNCSGWALFKRLSAVSPAPFAAYLNGGQFQLASSSPELFLRLSGQHILTRPIKGTRPRGADPTGDAQLSYDLQTSPKEMAELVMITDLLRNDLGRVCEYGSVQVLELARLERYAQVQHLVSTIEGRLRPDQTHLTALAHCFPGGSITGAPKFRAMEIIDELEPASRGPYTGCLGYLGFNRESQLNILIRTALCLDQTAFFQVGAGIVFDSLPEAEYEETLAKARGFLAALDLPPETEYVANPSSYRLT
jgi:para-aminobenzoate synthetase component 1